MIAIHKLMMAAVAYLLVLVRAAGFVPATSASVALDRSLPQIVSNDNREAAGTLADGTLTLRLRAGVGAWRQEKDAGPALTVEAFGEEDGPLQTPAPLIRVPEGTRIVASVRNELPFAMRVHGLCSRAEATCAPFEVPPGESREVRFASGPAGTYHYWATTTGMPLPFRAADDTQLSGAFIVDPPGADPSGDRVFVITDWTSLTREQLATLAAADDPGPLFFELKPKFTGLLNGLSWPFTERLTYQLGESIRWRVLNLSSQPHPMHLHGFYFSVDSLGNGLRDTAYAADRRQQAVTQVLQPGATMTMTWRAERVGNWMFHCHMMLHVSPDRRLGAAESSDHHHAGHDAAAGMAGMIVGVTIVDKGASGSAPVPAVAPAPRRMTLAMQHEPDRFGVKLAYAFSLSEGSEDGHASVPGPTLVLKRGEPVEITLVNNLREATAIHWHGMELESYYDGAHGWSGDGTRITPLIAPGEQFIVRFTPPRAGTFMYHTHMHDNRQLTSGLYGALLVLEPDDRFAPDVDHVVILGRAGSERDAPVVLNGAANAQFAWKADTVHRIRFINITPDDVISLSLVSGEGPVQWRAVAKDGARAVSDAVAVAAKQVIAVGETFDFEYVAPKGRQTLWIEAKSMAGRWLAQGRVAVK